MWIQRILSISPKFTPIRRLCQQTCVEEKPRSISLLSEAKTLYVGTLPFFMAGTAWASFFSSVTESETNKTNKCTFLEHTIYSFTTGIIVGMTFPISFPVIAFNTWRKRNSP